MCPVIGAYERNSLRFAVLGIESPGGSNLILVPFEINGPMDRAIVVMTLQEAIRISSHRGVTLSQIIGPERTSKWDEILQQAGYFKLTDLIYLTRDTRANALRSDPTKLSPAQRWVNYSTSADELFCNAIQFSYAQSLDCPELIHARTARQSLLSHRAVGVFDPATWFVLAEREQPLGVLLLNQVRRESVMEIVYMGVSQVERGRGVADVLMAQAVHVAAKKSASLILAVDARNVPAKRLYARWGMVEIARRAAWIANLDGAGR